MSQKLLTTAELLPLVNAKLNTPIGVHALRRRIRDRSVLPVKRIGQAGLYPVSVVRVLTRDKA
jgi:hypothetical protein